MSTPQPTEGQQKEYTFLLVGPTRSGKSSMINAICGKYLAQEGNDDSDTSTTSEIKTYSINDQRNKNGPSITFVDTIGCNDTTM
jgi:predicted GTPase